MKRTLRGILVFALLLALSLFADATQNTILLPIDDICAPIADAPITFSEAEWEEYRIVAQAWVEYNDDTLSAVSISSADSYYEEAYAGIARLTHFKEGLIYRYALVLTNETRVPFTEPVHIALCATELVGTVDAENAMYCIFEAEFVCGQAEQNASAQIRVQAPQAGKVPVSAEISEGYRIVTQQWFDENGSVNSFSDYTDHTLEIQFANADGSEFAALPTVIVNGLPNGPCKLVQPDICSVTISFPYRLVVDDIPLPKAGSAPAFASRTEYGPYIVCYQEWQELLPGGYAGRRCALGETGEAVRVGSAPLLTEFLPGHTYNLHYDLRRADGSAITQDIPLVLAGRTAKTLLYRNNLVSDTLFTVPFSFEVCDPAAGEAPTFSGFSSEYYNITEAWLQLNDEGTIVRYITSDSEYNDTIALGRRLLSFKEGQTYVYAVELSNLSNTELLYVPDAYMNGLCMHAGLFDSNCTLGYQRSFHCPTRDTAIKFAHSINLESDISLNYLIAERYLQDYDSFCLELSIPVYEGNTQVGTRSETLTPVLKGSYYYFTLEGLTALQMNDEVRATLWLYKNGLTYLSKTNTYSIAQYAYYQLNSDICDDSLKTLCAELLRYGASAQLWKGYRTDALADAQMTQEQQSYLCDLNEVRFGNHSAKLNDHNAPTVRFVAKSLSLGYRVAVRFYIDASAYPGDASALSAHVSYIDITGTQTELILTNPEMIDEAGKRYVFTLNALRAAELRTLLTAAVFDGETQVSCSTQYSADTYGNHQTGPVLTLCRALAAYSDAALTYFRK